MRILARYIFFRLCLEVLTTLAVVSCLLFVWLLLSKMMLVHHWIQFQLLVMGNLFALPTAIYKVFPWVMLFAVLRFFMTMAMGYEWTMMTSNGFGRGRIVCVTNAAILTLTLLFLGLGEVVAPASMITANRFFCHDQSVKQCPLKREGWVFNAQQMIHYHLNLKTGVLGPVMLYRLNSTHDALHDVVMAPFATHVAHRTWRLIGEKHKAGQANQRVSVDVLMPFSGQEIHFLNLKWRQLPLGLVIKMSIKNNFKQHASWSAIVKFFIDNFVWLSGVIVLINLFSFDFLKPLPIHQDQHMMKRKALFVVLVGVGCALLYQMFFIY